MQLFILLLIVGTIIGMTIRNMVLRKQSAPSPLDTKPVPPVLPPKTIGACYSVQNTTILDQTVEYVALEDPTVISYTIVSPNNIVELCVVQDREPKWQLDNAGPIINLNKECTL